MTEQEFDTLYERCLATLDAYIATQKTSRQVFDAQHRKRHVEINKGYFHGQLVKDARPYHLCRCCGMLVLSDSITAKDQAQMDARQLCFYCWHWTHHAENPQPYWIIVDGDLYSDGGKQPPGTPFLGFAGTTWIIEKGGAVWETNNLWCGGTIPAEFRDRLPDNARFINQGRWQASKDTPYWLKYMVSMSGKPNPITRYYADAAERDQYAAYLVSCGTAVTIGSNNDGNTPPGSEANPKL